MWIGYDFMATSCLAAISLLTSLRRALSAEIYSLATLTALRLSGNGEFEILHSSDQVFPYQTQSIMSLTLKST